MTAAFWLRVILGFVISGLIAHDMFPKWYIRDGEEDVQKNSRYSALSGPGFVPVVIAITLCVLLPKMGWTRTVEKTVSFGFSFVLTGAVYYILLHIIMKHMRKVLSARACALMWMLPSFLWFGLYLTPPMEPWYVLQVKNDTFGIIAAVWGLGFLGVWIWKVVEDIRFRREIMTGARVVTDPEIHRIWYEELEKTGFETPQPRHTGDHPKATLHGFFKGLWTFMQPDPEPADLQLVEAGLEKLGLRKIPIEDTLVVSPHVNTPLTIGGNSRFFMRVVLPEKEYTKEEIRLILRHELVHVFHNDSKNKRFLVFCKALCWFNPLMWMAMKRSAEDLELCCDEAVLLDEDHRTRKKYAQLILQTAGDERGFTTCLSASAASLRYRLKSIMNPGKKGTGVWAVCLAFTLLFLSFGHVTLGFRPSTGAQAVFAGEELTAFEIASVHLSGEQEGFYECSSEESLTGYLAQLPMCRLEGNYLSTDKTVLTVAYHGPEGSFGVTLRGRILTVTPLREDKRTDSDFYPRFYLEEEADWDYILSLLH